MISARFTSPSFRTGLRHFRSWSFEADVQARVLFHLDKQDAGWDICHYDWEDLTEPEQWAYVQRAMDEDKD